MELSDQERYLGAEFYHRGETPHVSGQHKRCSAKAHVAATRLFKKLKGDFLLATWPATYSKIMISPILHAVQSYGQSIWDLGFRTFA